MTEDRKAYMKAYREKNKEKLREYNKAYLKEYYKLHKDKIIKRAAEYNSVNIDKYRENERKWARKAYKEAKENLVISLYKLPADVIILDDKHILFNGDKYTITKAGYLTCSNKLFHIEYAKSLGIWFYGCDIHHINCDTLDNRKDNLIALTKKEHCFAHSLLKENKESYYNWIKNKISSCWQGRVKLRLISRN